MVSCPNAVRCARPPLRIPRRLGGFLPHCPPLRSGGFRGGAGGRLARSSGTVSARSLGMGPLVITAGTPLVGSVSSLPHPAHPGRGVGRGWSAPRAPERAVPVRQDRCSAVEHLACERLSPGAARRGLFLQRYRHDGPRFHSDTSAFTGIPRFASVITLAKCRFPFEISASLAKQTPTPDQGARLPFENAGDHYVTMFGCPTGG